MNPFATPWGMQDLEVTMRGRPDSYLVPKVQTKDDLLKIDDILSCKEKECGYPAGEVKLVVLATETPQGLLNVRDFGACLRVDALSRGAEDLSAPESVLGATETSKATFLESYATPGI